MRRTLAAIVALSCALACGAASAADKRALIAGGSCEKDTDGNPKPENTFYSGFAQLIPALRNRGWDVTAQFDGAAARCLTPKDNPACGDENDTERARELGCCQKVNQSRWSVAQMGKDSSTPAAAIQRNTQDNFFRTLDGLVADAESAQRTGKDAPEIYLHFLSHGHGSGDLGGHTICFDDGNYLDIHDPRLTGRLAALKKAGAKLGISDDSCYGGGSVRDLAQYGCVISGTSENRPARADLGKSPLVAQSFFDLLAKAKSSDAISLEDVHLRSLLAVQKNQLVVNQPQCSDYPELLDVATSANRIVQSPTRLDKELAVNGMKDESAETRCAQMQFSFATIERWLTQPAFTQVQQKAAQDEARGYLNEQLPGWNDLVASTRRDLAKFKEEFAKFDRARQKIQELQRQIEGAAMDMDVSSLSPAARAALRNVAGADCKSETRCSISESLSNSLQGGGDQPGLHDRLLAALPEADRASVESWIAGPLVQAQNHIAEGSSRSTELQADLAKVMAGTYEALPDKVGFFGRYESVTQLRAQLSQEANELRFYEIQRARAATGAKANPCRAFKL
jgi:hypothetical protein